MKRIGIFLLTLLLAMSILAVLPQMSVYAASGDQAAAYEYSMPAGGGYSSSGYLASARRFMQDTTPPVLQVPAGIIVDATSPQGAAVYYTVMATDPDDPSTQVSIFCSVSPGSMFPIGITFVSCSATDAAGNTSTAGFQVKVQKITAPTLHLPDSATVRATSAQGVVVRYTATATDTIYAPYQLTVNCIPASGSTFRPGTTTVHCSVTDPVGNMSTGEFQITVRVSANQVGKYR